MKKQIKSANELTFQKWLLYLIAVVTVYAAIIATFSISHSPKIGYVDSNILLEKYSGAVAARERLTGESVKWQGNIKTLETELTALNQSIIEENDKWDVKTRKTKKDELQKKQQAYLQYKQAVTQKATKLEQELMQNVLVELNGYMADFGKETGHEMIFGTLAGGNILYAQQATDLTTEFLGYIDTKI